MKHINKALELLGVFTEKPLKNIEELQNLINNTDIRERHDNEGFLYLNINSKQVIIQLPTVTK